MLMDAEEDVIEENQWDAAHITTLILNHTLLSIHLNHRLSLVVGIRLQGSLLQYDFSESFSKR